MIKWKKYFTNSNNKVTIKIIKTTITENFILNSKHFIMAVIKNLNNFVHAIRII